MTADNITSAKLTVLHDKRGRRTVLELFDRAGKLVRTYRGPEAVKMAGKLKCSVFRYDVGSAGENWD
jgi:hypothetical protein